VTSYAMVSGWPGIGSRCRVASLPWTARSWPWTARSWPSELVDAESGARCRMLVAAAVARSLDVWRPGAGRQNWWMPNGGARCRMLGGRLLVAAAAAVSVDVDLDCDGDVDCDDLRAIEFFVLVCKLAGPWCVR
jgi:hypothetical protein